MARSNSPSAASCRGSAYECRKHTATASASDARTASTISAACSAVSGISTSPPAARRSFASNVRERGTSGTGRLKPKL